MTNSEIATLIRSRFTPFAFTCSCEGAHPDCEYTRTQNVYAIAQRDTVEHIARLVENLED